MDLQELNLRGVSQFFVVQADGPEGYDTTITCEKEFNSLQDALKIMKESEAPIKYLKFNHLGSTYKLYPIQETGEYRVAQEPILN